jgi:hypothetical protein
MSMFARLNLLSPVLRRVTAYTSVEWPIFWRARYDVAALILLGAVLFVTFSPILRNTSDWITETTAKEKPLHVVSTLLAIGSFGFVSVLWIIRQRTVPVPPHALRAVNSPSFTFYWALLFTMILAGYTAIIQMSAPDTILARMRADNFIKEDGAGLGLWVMWLLMAAWVAMLLKIQQLFGWLVSLQSIAGQLLIGAVLGIAFGTSEWLLRTVGLTFSSQPAKTFGEMTIAVLVIAGLCLPSIQYFRSFSKNVSLHFSRLGAALHIWLAPYIAVAAFIFVVSAIRVLLGYYNQFGTDKIYVLDERFPANTGGYGIIVFTLLCVLAIEFAIRRSTRLLTLPEA